jgi:hypothetical protein
MKVFFEGEGDELSNGGREERGIHAEDPFVQRSEQPLLHSRAGAAKIRHRAIGGEG